MLVLAAVVPVLGQTQRHILSDSGNAFLSDCGDYDSAPTYCVTYVAGVSDGLQMSAKPAFCEPEHVTYGQSTRIVIKYAKDHPEALQLATKWLILLSHVDAFPCPAAAAKTP